MVAKKVMNDVDNDEVDKKEQLNRIQMEKEKSDAQRRLAWAAMMSMVTFPLLLASPMLEADRVHALTDLSSTLFIAQAGVLAAYFGAQAWATKSSK